MQYPFDNLPGSGGRSVVFSLAILLILATFPGGAARAETNKPPNPQAAKRGAKIYSRYCQTCHGANGVGEFFIPGNFGKPGYFPAPALDDSQHAWHHSDEDLVNFILEGSPRTPRMPAWKKKLSKKNAEDVVAYIKSLWGSRAIECQGPRHMSCM